ncbi:transcriptional regulator [Candidatus Nitrosopelagicus sp.]|nr:transcriptional regulator [Candidatus Nitrosopelagicus sp.]
MPEIWLNYGNNDVVLDILAENLEAKPVFDNKPMTESLISEKLESIDLSKPIEIALLNYTDSVQTILRKIFEKCENKSISKPKLLVDKRILPLVKSQNPEDLSIIEFGQDELTDSDLIFVSEMEFDGLFGFETNSTRLTKHFGKSKMLEAFKKRNGDNPNPGQIVPSIQVANNFVDSFEISSIEIVSNLNGIIDFSIGHPKSTMSLSNLFSKSCSQNLEAQKTFILSTGKYASNQTLSRSLPSLWNCYSVVKNQGLVILLSECLNGLGSEALQQFIDGRLGIEKIKNASQYIDGMENLLYLNEIQKKIQIGLVSILPETYVKKLNMIPFDGVKKGMDYILKNQGIRQKVKIIDDGARTILT